MNLKLSGTGTDDCDDLNSAINLGATEIYGNSIDNNCNNTIDDAIAAIEQFRYGGVKFWVDPTNNTKGKVCEIEDAPNPLNRTEAITYCTGYTNPDKGKGVYNNWYLPSKDELNLIYQNRETIDLIVQINWG